MKTSLKLGVATVLGLCVAGCALTAGEKKTVGTVLDVAKYACIIANAEFPTPKIAQVCQITDDLIPALQAILNDLATHDERAQARYAAARCEEVKSSQQPRKVTP
jgi:hypothetical protein